MPAAPELVHGTCVALGRRAALLRGPSGAGKSDLALRFLFLARRGPAALDPPTLVADDQVALRRDGERLLASAPQTIAGQIEARGLGIVGVKPVAEAELVLIVDLVAADAVERFPADDLTAALAGVDLPLLRLTPFEASAPIKLALALARAGRT
ncbi:MAG: HPr kinase/phosphatase C-terminal domain-containing protein [Hyphomonadaceae bacterium]|nr:HPr kinase/phosphatase C-terminal domain-containing protein [Hyphomonadaceae bacterium]